jgi:hypothetical protein
MKTKITWAIQSFFLCLLFNLALTAVIYFMADKVLGALNEWVLPLTGPGGPALPDDARRALVNFGNFAAQIRGYLMPVLGALASAFTLLLWFFLFLVGGRQIRKAGEMAGLPGKPGTAASQSIIQKTEG